MLPLWTMDKSMKSYQPQPEQSVIQSAGELKLSLRYEPPEDDEGKKKKQDNGHAPTQPETITQQAEPVTTSLPADTDIQVEPVAKPDDQPKILSINVPLPQPAVAIVTIEETSSIAENSDDENETSNSPVPKEHNTTAKPIEGPLVAPYPPGVNQMLKKRKALKIQGEIYLKVFLDNDKMNVTVEKATGLTAVINDEMFVTVEKATGLTATDRNASSDPLAVVYILPDHHKLTKQKTKMESNTVNPIWNACFLYPVPEDGDFTGQVLWVSVWHWNRLIKADFLGEVMLPLWTMDLHDKSMKSYQLQPEQSVIQSAGELKLSLRYEPPEDKNRKNKQMCGRLHVHILEAKDLFYDKSYAKGFLRPGKNKAHHHQQTKTVTQPKCPVYDEEMVFEKVTMETLSNTHVLEIAIWDVTFITGPMGVIRLGPRPTADSKPWMDSQDAEVSHWEAMLSHPNEWVEQWHILRPDGDFREVTKSNEDTLNASDVTRSSPDNDGEKSVDDGSGNDQTLQDKDIGPKPFSGVDPIAAVNQGFQSGGAAAFPQPVEDKGFVDMDEHQFKTLTEEDTKMNQGDGETASPVKSSGVKKQVSLALLDSDDDDDDDDQTLHTEKNSSDSFVSSHDDISQSTDHGQLKVSLQFNITNDKRQKGYLLVGIISGHNLLQTELTCNPVVKCQLLPASKKKFKTKVFKENHNPVWNGRFVFDNLKLDDLRNNSVIEVTVWDSPKGSEKEQLIGGLRLGPRAQHEKQLSYMDSSENELSHWMSAVNTPGECVEQLHTLRHNMDPLPVTLVSAVFSKTDIATGEVTNNDDETSLAEQVPVSSFQEQQNTSTSPVVNDDSSSDVLLAAKPVAIDHGQLKIALQVNVTSEAKQKGNVMVTIISGHNLLQTEQSCNPLVKLQLLPTHKKKFKTKVFKENHNPVWNDRFVLDNLKLNDLRNSSVIEVTVWDSPKEQLIGGLRLGPRAQHEKQLRYMDSSENELSHWMSAVNTPGECVEQVHTLRHNMDPLPVTLAPPSDDISVSTDESLQAAVELQKQETTQAEKLQEKIPQETTEQATKTEEAQAEVMATEEAQVAETSLQVQLLQLEEVKTQQEVTSLPPEADNVPAPELLLTSTPVKVSVTNTASEQVPLVTLSHEDYSFDAQLISTNLDQLKVSLQFNTTDDKKQKGDLVVTIISGHNLLQTELTCNPVVKCHLLPDHKKFKTKVLKDNHNPEWNEKFVFESLKLSDLYFNKVIEITVWDSPKSSKKEKLIGGLRLGPHSQHEKQLSYMDSSENELSHWMSVVNTPGECVQQLHTLRHNMDVQTVTLSPEPRESSGSPTSSLGTSLGTSQLDIITTSLPRRSLFGSVFSATPSTSLLKSAEYYSTDSISSTANIYSPAGGGKVQYDITGTICLAVYHTNNQLVVDVKSAKEIVGVNRNHLSNPYVKLYLLPDITKKTKRKTRAIRKSVNPVYNETFTFDGDIDSIEERTLQVSIWNQDRLGHNKFLGEVRLILKDVSLSNTDHQWYSLQEMDAEVNHLEAMLSHPNEWVEQWHILQPDGDFRDVTKSNEDTLQASGSYDVTRSSPDDDGEKSDGGNEQTLQDKDIGSKPVLAFSGAEPIVAVNPGFKSGGAAAFSQPVEDKGFVDMDEHQFKTLTEEDTKMNQGDGETASPVKSSGVKKQVSLALLDGDDDQTLPSEKNNSASFVSLLSVPLDNTDMQSVYSGSVMYTHDEVTGEIQMGVSYSDTENTLQVSINKIRGLTPPNKIDGNHTSPYVKTYLLPDQNKSTKKKTSVKEGVDPIFNETIKYPIKHQELSNHTLKVGVWHNDLFLGEVTLPLDKVDWSNPSDKWYGLEEQSHDDTSPSNDRGQLKVSLQFNITNDKKQKGDLVVTIFSGHNLLQTELTCNPVVKCQLLPDHKKKFKTKTLKDNHNPEWNEKFVYESLKLSDLYFNKVIEITVWDSPKSSKKEKLIGGLRLGPRSQDEKQLSHMDSSENELSHWMSVVNTPGECVEQVHTLRHNIYAQTVTLSPEPQESSGSPTSSLGTSLGTSQLDIITTSLPRRSLFGSVFSATPSTSLLKSAEYYSTDSISSTANIYSQGGGGKVQYDITGTICLAVYHTNNQLVVDVKSAKEIAGVNRNHLSNSYVKLYLLPDITKKTKRKTHTVRKSVNPEYNETFTFDGDIDSVEERTLHVSIWNQDRLGHNKFLGEVRLILKDVSLSNTDHQWYSLQEMADEDDESAAYVGDIRVMLQYVPEPIKKGRNKNRGCIHVWIHQSRQLQRVHGESTFVQCTLLPHSKGDQYKSDIIQGDRDPCYNAKFKFDKINNVELSYDRVLEITIWEPHRNTNEFVGGIRIGPKPQPGARNEWIDSDGNEVSQWEMMMAHPEEWIDKWHTLQSSMKP